MSDLDYSDPCAVLALLRPAYYQLLAGSLAETVRFTAGNGTTREITYRKANLADLRTEIAQLEQACAARSSGTVRRFGLRAGGV